MITNVLEGLKMRIESEFKRPAYIIDTRANAIDKNVIYIVSPRTGGVHVSPQLSHSNRLRFTIKLYEVVHVIDVTRQKDIVSNIQEALNATSETIEKLYLNNRNFRNICGANMIACDVGTYSWVVNTKVYTAQEITMNFVMYYDD